ERRSLRFSVCSPSTNCPSRIIRFSTCIVSRMHRQTVFLFASNPRIGNSILRNARAFSRKFTRTISPRWPLTNASRCLAAACAVASLIFGGGCEYLRQDMANQPKNRPLSPGAQRLCLRRYDQWFRPDAGLLGADSAPRPLGHHRVHSRAAAQPQHEGRRSPRGAPRETEPKRNSGSETECPEGFDRRPLLMAAQE